MLSRFAGARDGAIAIVFAFLILPVVTIVGFALDYAGAVNAQMRLQKATDAAVMAGLIEQLANNDPIAGINNYISTQIDKLGQVPTITITQDPTNGRLTVSGTMDRPNVFTVVVGQPTTTVNARSTAEAGTGGGKFEVSIAFDTTGSMAGAKLAAAKEAATQLVDQLYRVPGTDVDNANVKVGLVPFAQYVNIGLQYRGASWLTDATDYTTPGVWEWDDYPDAVYGTPIEHTYTCWADGIANQCSWTEWPVISYGAPVHRVYEYTNYFTWNGCVGSQQSTLDAVDGATSSNKVPALLNYYCPAPLIRLTSDKEALKRAISEMAASGETYIAPGLLWGWRTLSPNPESPFGEVGSALGEPAAAYGSSKKILILLTDGANTHSADYVSGDHGPADITAANAKVLETCQNIKAKGIEVYTILFSESDATIQDVLTQCSSGPPYHYSATTIADLQGVFTTIGAKLAGIRMVR
jgi:Flp pilus assembly protein TadG